MPRRKLQELIASLHRELERTPELDDDGRRMLHELTDDIEAAVGREEAPHGSRDSAVERVETAAVRIEAEHPRLAGILGEIVDTLGRLGI